MASDYYTTTSNTTFTIDPTRAALPREPRNLIGTAVARTQDGYLGQVLVEGQIVWESGYFETAQEAAGKAEKRITKVLSNLFAHKRSK